MEIFVYILSFISGGVVLTVAYNAVTTTRIYKDYEGVTRRQIDLGIAQDEQFIKNERSIKELVAEITKTRTQMESDNYKDLSKVNSEIKKLKSDLNAIRSDLTKVVNQNNGEVKKIYSDVMSLNQKINKVREDQTLNQNY